MISTAASGQVEHQTIFLHLGSPSASISAWKSGGGRTCRLPGHMHTLQTHQGRVPFLMPVSLALPSKYLVHCHPFFQLYSWVMLFFIFLWSSMARHPKMCAS